MFSAEQFGAKPLPPMYERKVDQKNTPRWLRFTLIHESDVRKLQSPIATSIFQVDLHPKILKLNELLAGKDLLVHGSENIFQVALTYTGGVSLTPLYIPNKLTLLKDDNTQDEVTQMSPITIMSNRRVILGPYMRELFSGYDTPEFKKYLENPNNRFGFLIHVLNSLPTPPPAQLVSQPTQGEIRQKALLNERKRAEDEERKRAEDEDYATNKLTKSVKLPPPSTLQPDVLFCNDQCKAQGSCENCIDPDEIPQIEKNIQTSCQKTSETCEEIKNDRDITCAPDPHVTHAYKRADISWPAETNTSPQEWSQIEPLLKLQYEWDKRVKNNTVRILTQNLHFRPYDIGSTIRTFLETIGAETDWGKEIRSMLKNVVMASSMGLVTGLIGTVFNPFGLVAGTAVGAVAGLTAETLKFIKLLAKTQIPWFLKEAILRQLEFSLEDRAWINKKFPGFDTSGQLFNECVEIHSQNAQERRACEFVGALTLMEDHERPHIICIQEATHEAANRILYDKLEFIGYKGVKQSDLTLAFPMLNPPGLAIFIHEASGIKKVAADSLIFGSVVLNAENPVSSVFSFITQDKKTIGADNLGYKGCLAVELLIPKGVAGMDEDTYIIVATIHPSPYVEIKTGDTLFQTSNWFCQVEEYGEVVKIHKKQLDDTEKFLTRFRNERTDSHLRNGTLKKGKKIQLYMTGDMNINRYAVRPDSDEEKNPFDASACCSIEYYDMLRRLNAEQPPVIPDPNQKRWETYNTKWEPIVMEDGRKKWQKTPSSTVKMPVGRGGLFTWDGEINQITKSPKWPESFSWIDYILYSKDGPKPLYMDNRAVRLTSKNEFPEVSAYFQPTCVMFRNELTKRYKKLIPKITKEITDESLRYKEKPEDEDKEPAMIDLYGNVEGAHEQTKEELRQNIQKLVRRKRDLKKKICGLETVNNQQKCETSKKCSIADLEEFENTYSATVDGQEKTFTCDYKPRITLAKHNFESTPNFEDLKGAKFATKAAFDKTMYLFSQINNGLRKIHLQSEAYNYHPEYNMDGTVTIDREEHANPNFHAEERETMQKNPFPMFKDISDHYSVLSVIMLPSETNKYLYNTTMDEYRRLGIDKLPVQESDLLEQIQARRRIGSMAPSQDFIEPRDDEPEPIIDEKPKLIDEGDDEIQEENNDEIDEAFDKLRSTYTKSSGWLGFGSRGILDEDEVNRIINDAIDKGLSVEYTEQILQDAEKKEKEFIEKEKKGLAVRASLPPPYRKG